MRCATSKFLQPQVSPTAMADKKEKSRKQASSDRQCQNKYEGFTAKGIAPASVMSCSLLKSKKDTDLGDKKGA